MKTRPPATTSTLYSLIATHYEKGSYVAAPFISTLFPPEMFGGDHLALRRGLDEALPRVGRVGDDGTEVELPLFQHLLLETNKKY